MLQSTLHCGGFFMFVQYSMFPLTAKQYEKKEDNFHMVLLVTGMFYCM